MVKLGCTYKVWRINGQISFTGCLKRFTIPACIMVDCDFASNFRSMWLTMALLFVNNDAFAKHIVLRHVPVT